MIAWPMWVKRVVSTVIAVLLVLHGMPVCDGHGVSKHTVIATDRGAVYAHKLYEDASLQDAHVQSYSIAQDFSERSASCFKNIVALAKGTADTHVHIAFDHPHFVICCTPQQPFYLPARGGWVLACQLYEGDELLKADGRTKAIAAVDMVRAPLEVYALEVEETHIFCVGPEKIITHNIALPIALGGGFECIVGASVAAGSLSATLGPLALLGGLVVGGVVAAVRSMLLPINVPLIMSIHRRL